jgi:predicted ATPase
MIAVKESIQISNFAGIHNLELDLSSVVVLIGPQASGKSVTVKLIFFFKSFFGEIFRSISNQETKKELDKRQIDKFVLYFPKEAWPKSNFKVTYLVNDSFVSIEKSANNQLKFEYSESIKRLIKKGRQLQQIEQKRILQDPKATGFPSNKVFRDKFDQFLKDEISETSTLDQLFVPAGRSFFANLQSAIFSFLSENKTLDPFLIEFGASYEFYKSLLRAHGDPANPKKSTAFEEILASVLQARYLREKDKDYLVHIDGRKVNLSYASSGQQEILPLLLILQVLYLFVFAREGTTLYIEEPEAHLFPTAQKKIVQLLARVINKNKGKFQIIVTTHGPYILSSFNNLIQAGSIEHELESEDKTKLFEIVPGEEIIDPNSILAYSMNEGKKELLIDKETQLISGDILDSVSNEISIEFGKMLDLEFGVK